MKTKKQFSKPNSLSILMFFVTLVYWTSTSLPHSFADESISNQLVSITEIISGKKSELIITSKLPLVSTVYTLPNPNRIIIDCSETTIADDFTRQGSALKTSVITIETITDSKPKITRLQITPNKESEYSKFIDNNTLKIELNEINYSETTSIETDKNNQVNVNTNKPNQNGAIDNLINKSNEIQKQLPNVNPLDKSLSKQATVTQMQDAFNFSGYNKERITVEFQKMDLHNVFNFLRQVSGVNIVVDESVQGSLTLFLEDVPWDFALDIILNLKNLEKENRFNTLVIYPKGKGFVWPKQAEQNLSFEADNKVVEQEALSIKQLETQSFEVIESKQYMSSAFEAEKKEKFETAIELYEKAYEKWPSNSKLANQIASIYLVQLRQNAKALYFAEKSFNVDPENSSAYLNAGIAASNMQEFAKAKKYFEKSVSFKQPSKESLLSFAAFCESRSQFDNALSLLEKHDHLFGQDLNSMVSNARIYDKMGNNMKAVEKYNSIIHAGFQIPQDLDSYIKHRLSTDN